MFKLQRGINTVQLSLTSSFTPVLEFKSPFTGDIKLCKKHSNNTPSKEAVITATEDTVLDLGSCREYFTSYRDGYNELELTIDTKATLLYESFTDTPAIDFGLEENPDYKPPEPEAQKCPICQQEVPMSDLMLHIQSTHM